MVGFFRQSDSGWLGPGTVRAEWLPAGQPLYRAGQTPRGGIVAASGRWRPRSWI